MGNITFYLYKYIIFYRYINDYAWTIITVVFVLGCIFLIKKYSFSARKIALFGFVLLFATMILSIFSLDDLAGSMAQFVWILFTISFIMDFYHFLKHENK